MCSDYYNSLALADANPMAIPPVVCAGCAGLVRVDDQVECEFCGAKGCPECMEYNRKGDFWQCVHDTDCGEERQKGKTDGVQANHQPNQPESLYSGGGQPGASALEGYPRGTELPGFGGTQVSGTDSQECQSASPAR
jgi:hypothetical protein